MLKIDVEYLNCTLLNNRSAHSDYLKHTQEEAAILREILEQEKLQNSLNESLDYACKYTKQIQELLIIVGQTYPSINNSGDKFVAVIPKNKNKRVRFTEPVTSSGNTNTKIASSSNLVSNKHMLSSTGVKTSTSASRSQPSGNIKKDKIQRTPSSTQKNKHSKLNVNSEPLCVKCNGCMLSDNHDLCVLNFINDVNARIKSKSVKKISKRKVWKPTGKVFTNIGYTWRPIGRTFNIIGNACPLTRITTTAEEPSKSWGSIVSDIPSSSLDEFSSSKLFSGTIKFGNDHVAKILGYGDYQIGNITISRVYYMEGLGHNLLSIGQFCNSNLEVAFRQHTCFIRNLKGVDLLTGSRGNNLYTLSLGDMMVSSLICLLSKASKTKSWLWHRRLSHLNFGAINHLARHGLVRGLPKLKFEKDHLYSACAMGKSKKKPHKPKSEDTNQEKLYLLHIDLCGPIRVASVNGKKYILVIVADYSRFTWVKCLRTNNGTESVNQTLREYYEKAKAVAITCYTQNRSSIHLRHYKTPYELLHEKLLDLLFIHVFGALCYPTNDSENLGKLQLKADIGIFIGYAPTKKAFQIYNRRTRRIIETIHVYFDELTSMASEHSSLGPALYEMTPATISSGLMPNPPPSTLFVPPLRTDWDILFCSTSEKFRTSFHFIPSPTMTTNTTGDKGPLPQRGCASSLAASQRARWLLYSDMSNSDELRHTDNTTLIPPRLPDTLPQVYHRRRPTLGLLVLPSVSLFSPTIRRTARISVLPI
ncbi:retrovirus-related pol polyprotein from transposon TNT 1-94 [Tanacetum coccineum]